MPAHLDVQRLRTETAGCANVIHFNNAGAALMPDVVFDAVTSHLELERSIGGYEAAAQAAPQLAEFYAATSGMLHCQPDEVAFVENATRAWDMAFYGVPFEPGDVILTSEAEYASNYIALLHMAERRGVRIEIVPSNVYGEIDLDALEAALRMWPVRLVSLTHVPTQSGLINPAAEVGALCRRYGALYLLDACQSAGQMPLDVQAIGCDMLSGTGRKFLRGPRGTGFLFVRRDCLDRLDPPFLDLHAAELTGSGSYALLPDARRFENWESFVAGRIGLGVAVRYALDLGIDAIWARIEVLAARLRDELSLVAGISVQDPGRRRSGIVTFTRSGEAPDEIKTRLAAAGINVSVSSARYALLDLGKRGLDSVVRASLHCYNTEDEIERMCEVLRQRS